MLVRHDGFIARWLSYCSGPLHYVWERGWHHFERWRPRTSNRLKVILLSFPLVLLFHRQFWKISVGK